MTDPVDHLLRDALHGFFESALPAVQPPGVEVVYRNVRHVPPAAPGGDRGLDVAVLPSPGRQPPVEPGIPERGLFAVPGRDFAAFYAANFRSLCAQLFVHTGNLAEAQDVVQEAFTRAYARWHVVADYDDPAAWVRKVAWNLATTRWRRLRHHTTLAPQHLASIVAGPTPDRVAVRTALASLSPRQRRAVVLHYLVDLPISEIAVLTGATEGTVKSWLHRARITLAARLAEQPAGGERGTAQ